MSNVTEQITNPQPLGVAATPELALTEVSALRRELSIQFSSVNTRFDAMDKAAVILHEDTTRVPTQIDKAINWLRELLESRLHEHDRILHGLQVQLDTRIASINGQIEARIPIIQASLECTAKVMSESLRKEVGSLDGKINVVVATAEEQLKSVQMQFLLLKQATEQLDIANKTAIAAALQAQKESAGETQKTSQAAIAKSEASTSEAIKALTTTFNVAVTSLSDRFLDLKGRLDRGEGRSTVTDPGMEQLAAQVRDLVKSRDNASGMGYMVVTGISVMVALVTVGVAVARLVIH